MPSPNDPPPPLPGSAPPPGAGRPEGPEAGGSRRPRPSVRTTLVRVLVVQAVTLAFLGLLQWGFGG